MRITVIAKPNKPETGIAAYDKEKQAYTINLRARPEKNKANIELMKFLMKHFKKEVTIVNGLASRKKVVELK